MRSVHWPLHLAPSSIPVVSSWPGLADICITYAENERDTAVKSKKGLGESDICKVLRQCIKAADSEQRSGESGAEQGGTGR